jgi:hypothetical protein
MFVHALPFHDSARGPGEADDPICPAAKQEVEETHATEFSWLRPTVSVRLATTCHDDPFQLSMIGVAVAPPLVDWEPTAVHHVLLRQETPMSTAVVPLGRFAGVVMLQELPFQVSTSALEPPMNPTATQNVGLVHDTPLSQAPLPTDGVFGNVQFAPFQLMTSGLMPPSSPTATQNEALGHDTPSTLRKPGVGDVGTEAELHDDGTAGGGVSPSVGEPKKSSSPPARVAVRMPSLCARCMLSPEFFAKRCIAPVRKF